MTVIMIMNVRFKYTAIGRKEIQMFFYLYAVSLLTNFLVISGIVTFDSDAYRYFVALDSSISLATLWCLFMNGIVPFQFIEDGTPLSLWLLRLSTLFVFVGSYFVNMATFNNVAGMASNSPGALWTLTFVFSAAFVLIYFIFQLLLVFTQLGDTWLIGTLINSRRYISSSILYPCPS